MLFACDFQLKFLLNYKCYSCVFYIINSYFLLFQGRQAIEWVIDKINTEVVELKNNAVKSTDEILSHTKRSIDDITSSAKKSMDEFSTAAKKSFDLHGLHNGNKSKDMPKLQHWPLILRHRFPDYAELSIWLNRSYFPSVKFKP